MSSHDLNIRLKPDTVLIVDGANVDTGVLQFSKLELVTSQPVECSSNILCDSRLIVLSSTGNRLGVKDADFSLRLDALNTALNLLLRENQDGCEERADGHIEFVWPIHCMTSSRYLEITEQDMPDAGKPTGRDGVGCERGFLIEMRQVTASTLPDQTTVPVYDSWRLRIEEILRQHAFDVALQLFDFTGSHDWMTAMEPDKVGSDVTSSTSRNELPVMRLAELTGDDLERCSGVHPAFCERRNNVVFHGLKEVIETLNGAKIYIEKDKINELLEYCTSLETTNLVSSVSRQPFIVIEGLDATGKSTVVSNLVQRLSACQLYSPPQPLQHLRPVFDSLPSAIRRAYYSLGNYIVAETARQMTSQLPVILDRYWHSTAAYAISEEGYIPNDGKHWVYKWPDDLFKPTIVILLVVSEQVRCDRLKGRQMTEGIPQTAEERKLARDDSRRQRVLDAYRKMNVIEISAEGSPDDVLQRVLDILHTKSVI